MQLKDEIIIMNLFLINNQLTISIILIAITLSIIKFFEDQCHSLFNAPRYVFIMEFIFSLYSRFNNKSLSAFSVSNFSIQIQFSYLVALIN